MTSEHFTLWLQGFAELNQQPPTPEQWQSIREHLATVFDKRTPEVGAPIGVDGGPYANDETNAQKARGMPWTAEELRELDAALLERIRRQEREEKPYKLDDHVRIIC